MANKEGNKKMSKSFRRIEVNPTSIIKNKLQSEQNDEMNDSTSSYEVNGKWISNPHLNDCKVAFGETSVNVCEEQNSATSVLSESDFVHKDIPTKDSTTCRREKVSKTEGSKHITLPDSQLNRGFSESSCLSTLHNCLDDPKIKCHCRNKYCNNIQDVDSKQLRPKSCEIMAISSKCPNRRTDDYEILSVNNGQNDMFDSPATDSDNFSNRGKGDFIFVDNSCKTNRNTHLHTHDSRYYNGGHEVCIQSKPIHEDSMPELYAAKVTVDSEDVPKQIIFNAVNTSDYHKQQKKQHKKITSFFGLKSKRSLSKVKDDLTKHPLNDFQATPCINSTSNNISSGKLERIEVYYFDHGCAGYFRTTDFPPPLSTENLAERIDKAATKFWAEIFGIFHVAVAIVITFFLQLLRFILYSTVRPLIIGIIQITADYLIKPLLAIIFNGLLQPIFIFVYNIMSSFKDICELVAQSVGYFLKEIANVLRAIRLVDVKNNTRNLPYFHPKYINSEV